MAPGPTPTLTMDAPGVDQVAGAVGRHHVARGQRQAEVEGGDRLDGVEHLDLVAVGGVDDQQVDAGLGECAGLGAHVAVDPDRGGDAQPARARRRPGCRCPPGSRRCGSARRPECRRASVSTATPTGACSSRSNTLRGSVPTGAVTKSVDRDVADPGEPVDARRTAASVTRPTGRSSNDHHRGTVRALVDQRGRVGDRVVRGQHHRGVGHQVAALDEVDGLPDRRRSAGPAAARRCRRGGRPSRPSGGRRPPSCWRPPPGWWCPSRRRWTGRRRTARRRRTGPGTTKTSL